MNNMQSRVCSCLALGTFESQILVENPFGHFREIEIEIYFICLRGEAFLWLSAANKDNIYKQFIQFNHDEGINIRSEWRVL